MGTETNNQREQLEFEDIKSELDAIVASLGEYNKNVPLDKLSDIASMAKSYGIYDNLAKIYEVSQDKDIPSAIAAEVAKMGGSAAGAWAGIQLGALLGGNPLAIIILGATGAFLGEEGVAQFEEEIREWVKGITDAQQDKYNDWNNATPEERANWVNAGGLPYGAYNPSNSFVPIRRNDPLVLDLNGDGIINTISVTNSKAFFDTNGDGMKELTGWISGEDELTLSFIKPMKCINNSLYKANFAIVA